MIDRLARARPMWLLLLTAAAPLHCAGVVAPGLAYPDAMGVWRGAELSACRQWALRLHRSPAQFTPILQASDAPRSTREADVLFLPQNAIAPPFQPRAILAQDDEALLVPAASLAHHTNDLVGQPICVEPGSAESLALEQYFASHHLRLREFVFQEVDEMHDAYLAGRCAAIASPVSLLVGLRGNADVADRILPEHLSANPIMVAVSPALKD